MADTNSVLISEQAQSTRSQWSRSLAAETLRTFLNQKAALSSLLVLIILAVLALVGPALAPYDPTVPIVTEAKQPPSLSHWMGTDQYGRDILSRIMAGTRNTLGMPILAIGLATVFGVIPGLIAGYAGGWVDSIFMRLVDVLLSFPGILLALMIVAMVGAGQRNILLAVGISLVPVYMRMTRGSTLSIRHEAYVESAQVIGSTGGHIMRRHVLPNIIGPLIVLSTTAIGWAILAAAALNFLGLGVAPPTPEWGRDMAEGRNYLIGSWWITTFPGLVTMITILSVNLVGDALGTVLDPKMRSR